MGDQRFADDTGYFVKVAQHAFRTRIDHALAPVGLTTPQYAVLNALIQLGRASNAELARAGFVTPQSMHAVVAGLQEQGLVRLTDDPDHGRIRNVSLTAKGRARFQRAAVVVGEVERSAVVGVTAHELRVARGVLERIVANLAG
jgi:DNA-binding MarR family transcriptional regulator